MDGSRRGYILLAEKMANQPMDNSDAKSAVSVSSPYSKPDVQNQLGHYISQVSSWVYNFNVNPVAGSRTTSLREALFWMVRRELQILNVGPHEKEAYDGLLKYVAVLAKLTRNKERNPDGTPKQTAKARALDIVDNIRAMVNKMSDDLTRSDGKEFELEEAQPGDSFSDLGFVGDQDDSPYRDFYSTISRDLFFSGSILTPYKDAQSTEHKLILFDDVRVPIDKSYKVTETIKNLIKFVRDVRDYLPYLYSAQEAYKAYPGILQDEKNRIAFLNMVNEFVVRRADLEKLYDLAEALKTQRLTVGEIKTYATIAEERLNLTRQIQTLESELKAERSHTAMQEVIGRALQDFAKEKKENEQLIFEVLKNDNALDRLRDLYKIYQFARGRNLPPDDLWKILDDYRTLDAKLKLQENKDNVSQQLQVLLKLLDDNLLQPEPTFKLLRQLISDLGPSGIQSAAETIRKLTRRNSDLSVSFRQTLVAMGTLLQVMQDVSKRYAIQVFQFVESFSTKMLQVISSWGLAADNPLTRFVNDLTVRFFANNYSVEIKTGLPGTLDLTFNSQGLDLSTDAVFLHTVSLLKWLDRFFVDPKRPGNAEMAGLWNRVTEGLYDWQQQVIDTFTKTDVSGQAQPVNTIANSILSATRGVSGVMEQSLRQASKMTVETLSRFGEDLKTQEDRLNRRVEYLLTKPALGQYVLTVNVNSQDSKTEQKARDLFKAFIDATRVALLENKKDDANSVEVMAEINKLANEMDKLKFESNVKDSEYKRLESEHKKLETDFKTTDKAKRDAETKISDAQRELTTPAAKALVGLQSDLVIDLKAVLKVYGDKLDELEQTSKVVTAMATKYGVALNRNAQASVLLFKDMDAVLDFFSKKYDDWEETEKLVFAYANQKLRNVSPLQKDLLKKNTETVLNAYEKYRADFDALYKDEDKWWGVVEAARYPKPQYSVEDQKERSTWITQLSNTVGVLDTLAQRRAIVLGWIKSLADLIDQNDLFTVKELINKAKGKGSSSAKSAASASQPSAPSNPYYRVQFNGEVDTLTGGEVFPVFLPSTPFMRLWLFAREFAGAASNQLGNILEPLAPGLEINDERTLFILRTYQNQNPGPKDNPDLPTGAKRAELAKQQLADDEDKQNLKETAEERRKFQEKVALEYIKQLDDYKDLDQYEIKVRQYFKEMAMNALVHCQEILQRSDLPDFRRITLAELINSLHLSSGFARMCGLYLLVKQGTVPGMISTQSSAANRVAEFDQHARNLPRMYRRQGKYVWEVVRIPSSISDKTTTINKRIRL